MPFLQKTKILNDPIYGFIKIPQGLLFDIISLPCFQRLRRIRQLGLTNLVYPGANHNRLQHALGAMHLMQEAIDVLRLKGVEITLEESEGVLIAILLHDIGHGPFSHSLEYNIIDSLTHDDLSLMFMEEINKKFNGKLNIAIQIFKNTYKKKFLHQLVSGQLDATERVDRHCQPVHRLHDCPQPRLLQLLARSTGRHPRGTRHIDSCARFSQPGAGFG